jgi:hypothetical protein
MRGRGRLKIAVNRAYCRVAMGHRLGAIPRPRANPIHISSECGQVTTAAVRPHACQSACSSALAPSVGDFVPVVLAHRDLPLRSPLKRAILASSAGNLANVG